jgi:hypothetical protein
MQERLLGLTTAGRGRHQKAGRNKAHRRVLKPHNSLTKRNLSSVLFTRLPITLNQLLF